MNEFTQARGTAMASAQDSLERLTDAEIEEAYAAYLDEREEEEAERFEYRNREEEERRGLEEAWNTALRNFDEALAREAAEEGQG